MRAVQAKKPMSRNAHEKSLKHFGSPCQLSRHTDLRLVISTHPLVVSLSLLSRSFLCYGIENFASQTHSYVNEGENNQNTFYGFS